MRRDVVSMMLVLRPPGRAGSLGGRLRAAALTIAGGTGLAVGVSQSVPSGRAVVLVYLLAAPALAIGRLLPSFSAQVALSIGAAGAVAINALVALTMLAADAWFPAAGIVVVGLVSALILLMPRAEFPDQEINRCTHVTVNDHLISKGVNT
ncbi:hypothetical protein [Mycolicibacterium sarraceniae]|uniref:Uncharacterized protein n=1 Tax=Mycolicibacterium sarraceniae TaxID=1534348 RepID=A0A7I7SSC5_9MYCO|nr:hypothetical protein [Mycolicibacterium sarraceniae]BBY59663.1 hypothetical protein MSAR_27990 [Mycolicibacterium sarraceniae]